MRKILRIAFLAPTGYGKTTAAKLIEKNFWARNIKLATPLYDMQNLIYDRLHVACTGQDGELLQFLGAKIQKDYPDFLFEEFLRAEENVLRNPQIEIIVNDDCRPHNYLLLKKHGFLFVGIKGGRHSREDKTPIDPMHKVEWRQSPPTDYLVENTGDISVYEKNLVQLINGLKD